MVVPAAGLLVKMVLEETMVISCVAFGQGAASGIVPVFATKADAMYDPPPPARCQNLNFRIVLERADVGAAVDTDAGVAAANLNLTTRLGEACAFAGLANLRHRHDRSLITMFNEDAHVHCDRVGPAMEEGSDEEDLYLSQT